ncbi:MAG: PEP-CTERM sorting domain-containing protein [Verrucomicrobiae bacterium]|nr:PEP-CTERM sorting domain-containing protein [Verrucomicrobiae bacterium]
MKKIANRSLKVKAACVAAGLVSTWDLGVANAAQSFSGEITPTHDLSSVYFLFSTGGCVPTVYSKKIGDFLAANTTTAFNFTLNAAPDYDAGQSYGFTVIGVYDTVNGGVALGYDPTQAANILAQSTPPQWVNDFIPRWSSISGVTLGEDGFGLSEASAAAALAAGIFNGTAMDDAHLSGAVHAYAGPFPFYQQGDLPPSSFTLLDFSGASFGGSGFVVQAVPEPSTIAFGATGTALLSFGWRRRRHAARTKL